MREVVSINVGQAGVQLANAAWELFCTEHGISANGRLQSSLNDEDSTAFTTFFQACPNGQYVPRVISFDMEPTVLDEVRTGVYRNLFHPDQLISGFEDAANNFARGHFTIGKFHIDLVLEQIRKIVECCDYMQNFFLINSFGGGTGSGFTTLLMDRLAIEFSNRQRIQVSVTTSPVLVTSVVEPYNATLTIHSSMECADIAILTDNEAAYAVCVNSLDVSRPTYANLNRLVSTVLSDMTVSSRFEGTLSADLYQIVTNLVPYPRIHFPIMAHAPNMSSFRADHQQLDSAELARIVFSRDCSLLTCNPSEENYMSCCLQFRGDVSPKDANLAIQELRRRRAVIFVDWCPTGFKVGLCGQPPATVPASESASTPRSVSLLASTVAIRQSWQNLERKFNQLFLRRAFVHWFVGEGMEEGELNEAREDLTILIADYTQICGEEGEERERTEPPRSVYGASPTPPVASSQPEVKESPERKSQHKPVSRSSSDSSKSTTSAEDSTEESSI